MAYWRPDTNHSNMGGPFFHKMTGQSCIFVTLFFMLIPIAPMAYDFPFLPIVAVVNGLMVTIWQRDLKSRHT